MATWYNTGLVAVTNGNAAVTGTSTAWVANVLPGEAFLGPDGRIYEILSVNSNTSITLASNYLGTTQTGQAYYIIPVRGIDRTNQNLLTDLITNYQSVVTGIGAGLFPDGTASVPAGRFAADQDTGPFREAANTYAIATGGVRRVLWDGAYNMLLGNGTSAVFSAANRTTLQMDGTESVLLAFRSGGENRGYIFGQSTELAIEANPGMDLRLSTLGTNSLIINTSNAEKWRFLPSGFLLGAKTVSDPTTQGIEIDRAGTFYATSISIFGGYFNRLSSDGPAVVFARQNTQVGSISVTTTATAYNTSSDYRLKEIEGPLTGSGDFIDALNPVRGTWKEGGETFIGLIAHEVQEVCETQVATGEQDGKEMQALAYGAPEIMAHIIAELKSLRARVAALEAAA